MQNIDNQNLEMENNDSMTHQFGEEFSNLIINLFWDDMKRLSDEDIIGDYKELYDLIFDEKNRSWNM